MERNGSDPGRLRVRRKTLEALLAECQRAIQLGTLELEGGGGGDDSADDSEADDSVGSPSSASFRDDETTERQLCDLIKSRVECPEFLEKLESAQVSASLYNAEESASWDMVNENDAWEGDKEFDQEYVLVRQEDILDGIACFMATYLLSLKETKELTPNQLQDVLSKAFSVKKKKGKLRKAWDGSRVVYNVASWGATAIGIYQNPAILKAASAAFWTSCHVISKLF